MEADTVYSATDRNELEPDNACQMKPEQQDARAPDGAIQQPHPDDAPMVSETAVSPMKEKPFPFLRLPAEVRNMVYRQRRIYSTTVLITLPDLRQAPITRVNQQLRQETLPIF
ncbi:hypothetical protein INS49_014376 [Diaporthe citri]|uniref:uncharacterized protein n=1 Tax=Diaporthe citri TaxID=83186 RepID=UPI001C7F3262|nr:uncharacterized protein INS49_014376 [Diaporthe citri]KAG6358492.1 hypothetical protein INS49_014376 [Diaporthe citri]